MAAALLIAWIVAGARLILPPAGGPLVLLGLLVLVPVVLSAVAIIRPHAPAEGDWPQHVIGLAAIVLTLSVAGLLAEPAISADRGFLMVSAEMSYAALAALVATVIYTARQISVTGARLIAPPAIALTVLAGGTALVLAGPFQDVPAHCGVPVPAEGSMIRLDAWADLDGEELGRATVVGERYGRDERWTASLAGGVVTDGRVDFVRVGGRTWIRRDSDDWSEVQTRAGREMTDDTLEGRLIAVLATGPMAAAEDFGVQMVNGVEARHCRIAIDGTTAIDASPPLAWLTGSEPPAGGVELNVWRGDLDWWAGPDGRLVYASVMVGGLPFDAWEAKGMRGRLQSETSFDATTTPRPIEEPLP